MTFWLMAIKFIIMIRLLSLLVDLGQFKTIIKKIMDALIKLFILFNHYYKEIG